MWPGVGIVLDVETLSPLIRIYVKNVFVELRYIDFNNE